MKYLQAVAVAALLFAPAMAGAVEPPNPKDLTQGKWAVNVAKSKYCGPAPQKSERSIVDVGWGMIVTTWTGADHDGKPMNIHYVARYDGGKYPAEIDRPATESISWKLVNPSRLEFVHYDKADKVTSTYVRVVSADGQTMTQTSTFVGQACEDVQVFERR